MTPRQETVLFFTVLTLVGVTYVFGRIKAGVLNFWDEVVVPHALMFSVGGVAAFILLVAVLI